MEASKVTFHSYLEERCQTKTQTIWGGGGGGPQNTVLRSLLPRLTLNQEVLVSPYILTFFPQALLNWLQYFGISALSYYFSKIIVSQLGLLEQGVNEIKVPVLIPIRAAGSALRKAVPLPEEGPPSCLPFRQKPPKSALWGRKGQ